MNKSLCETHNSLEDRAARNFAEALAAAFRGRHVAKRVAQMMRRHGKEPHINTICQWINGERLPSWEYWLVFVNEFGAPLVDLVHQDAVATDDSMDRALREFELRYHQLRRWVGDARTVLGASEEGAV